MLPKPESFRPAPSRSGKRNLPVEEPSREHNNDESNDNFHAAIISRKTFNGISAFGTVINYTSIAEFVDRGGES